MRIFYRIWCVIVFLTLALATGVVEASSYTFQARQLNPSKTPYTAICDDSKDFCHLFMGIVPQNGAYFTDDIELDVGIVFQNDNVYFQFKSGSEYFLISDKKSVFSRPLVEMIAEKQKVALYRRSPMAKNDPQNSGYGYLVVRPTAELVAELEISVSLSP